jgi:hypothetical protein
MRRESAPKGASRIDARQKDQIQNTGFRVGQKVTTLPTVRPEKFADRTGIVSENRRGEVGVRFGTSNTPAVWFRPCELEPLSRARKPRQRPATAEGGRSGAGGRVTPLEGENLAPEMAPPGTHDTKGAS